jgi:uncharacterized protein YjgD (DUF1641 family)
VEETPQEAAAAAEEEPTVAAVEATQDETAPKADSPQPEEPKEAAEETEQNDEEVEKRIDELLKEGEAEADEIDLEDPEVAAAAAKIQAGFRGMLARKEVKNMKEVGHNSVLLLLKTEKRTLFPHVCSADKLRVHVVMQSA